MKNLILGFCLLLISIPLALSQEEVTVSSIHVWIAIEGSKALLTEKDFEIYEDGKRMTPTCFEKIQLSQALSESSVETEAGPTVPAELLEGKRIAIFVDQLNTSKPELAFVRPKVFEFLKQIDGKARIMLAAFPPYEPLVAFTTDVNEIRNELESLDGNHQRDLEMMERRRQIELVLESQVPPPLDKAALLALQFQQVEMQELQLFLESLKQLSKNLGEKADEEHSVVVLISGGINSRPGQQYFDMIRHQR